MTSLSCLDSTGECCPKKLMIPGVSVERALNYSKDRSQSETANLQ